MLNTIALVIMMLVHSNGTIDYATTLYPACPPKAILERMEAQVNDGMFANQIRASALCIYIPAPAPQRES